MDRESRDHHAGHAGGYDGGYRRGLGRRPTTDYGSSMVRWMRNRRPLYKGSIIPEAERPSASYVVDMLLPAARPYNAADTVPTKHLHSSLNKIKHPINIVRWTPEGRRCLTGSSSGEFTLWNGMAFNFETIMQAHDAAIRAAAYSHGEDWLISADHDGVVKYWQPNFNNVKALQAHNDAVRDIAFSPNDGKFVTACDDATLKIFDFAGGTEESALTGHNWDVKSVDWHPTKGLLVSGSKDHQVKLWDPRTGRCLTTLHGHKNTISKTLFEPNRGQLLATCARDQTARIFDLRMMRDICLLKGHEKEISTLTWHPIHASLLTTGGADGSIFHFLLDEPNAPLSMTPSLLTYDSSDPTNTAAQAIYPAHRVQYAHDFAIWSLSWHPLGHILASGSNDRVTRFWTRSRPGESRCFNDRYHLGEAGAEAHGTWDRRGGHRTLREEEEQEVEDEAEGLVDQKMPAKPPLLPGLPGLAGAVGAANDRIDPPINLHIPARTVNGSNTAPPGMPSSAAIAGINPHQFANMIAEGQIIVPPPPIGQHFLPPPPPNFDISKLPPEILANFPMPAGFPPPPHISNIAPTGQTRAPIAHDGRPAIPEVDYGGSSGIRKRAPLPSQHESLLQEQRKGNFRTAR